MFEVIGGFLLANWADWAIHRFILHGVGKKKGNFFNFHWHDHHNACRKGLKNLDGKNYKRSIFQDNPHAREFWMLAVGTGCSAGLLGLLGLHTMAATVSVYAMVYYGLHAYSHSSSPDLLPWHKDHHVGRNQDSNWCVVVPLMDHIMGTRIKQ